MKVSTYRERVLARVVQVIPRFFARMCEGCRSYFKGEPMWKHRYSTTYDSNTDYWCLDCRPTKEEVVKHWLDLDPTLNKLGEGR